MNTNLDPHAKRSNVLVVDDEPPVVKVYRQMLERAGYRIVPAFTYDEVPNYSGGAFQ